MSIGLLGGSHLWSCWNLQQWTKIDRYADTWSVTPMSVLFSFHFRLTSLFHISVVEDISTERSVLRHDDETILSAFLILSSAVKLETFSKKKIHVKKTKRFYKQTWKLSRHNHALLLMYWGSIVCIQFTTTDLPGIFICFSEVLWLPHKGVLSIGN